MSQTAEASRSVFQKLLDWVERVGNKVPHPAVLFGLMIVAVILLSAVLNWFGVGVIYQRINLETHKPEETTTAVHSLLSADGIRFICTSVVPNFINFGPVGMILVAMMGIGLAERAGLFGALIRKIVLVAPPRAMTAIVITLGVVSSIASDAGYLVLIPLGAAAFLSLKRHPLVGLAAAFAGVANFLVKPIDGVLAEMATDAARGIASSLLLIVVCTVVTDWLVQPRFGPYGGEVPAEEGQGLSPQESRGLLFALLAVAAAVGILCLLVAPPRAPLRHPVTGAILGDSPFMDSLIFIIMLVFGVAGVAYGLGAGTFKTMLDGIKAITRTLADLSDLLLVFFVISQFVAYFTFSNIGTVLAVQLANFLKEANLGAVPLLLGFIVIGVLLSIPVPNIIPKWAIIAPIFVPLFLKLGVEPEVVLAAYRVSDSPPNVVNPMLPHFALVVGFAQRYRKDAGVGTIVAMMLPYAAATLIAWTLLFFVWYLLGLPFGPG